MLPSKKKLLTQVSDLHEKLNEKDHDIRRANEALADARKEIEELKTAKAKKEAAKGEYRIIPVRYRHAFDAHAKGMGYQIDHIDPETGVTTTLFREIGSREIARRLIQELEIGIEVVKPRKKAKRG